MLADVDDFLAWVQGRRERYEFVGGRLVMMAGGSEDHNDIQVNLLTAETSPARRPCKPNGSDLLVRIDDRTGRFPDASVTCGREGRYSITAPVAIFEILSPATELADRTDKRRDYQRLASLRPYILIAQDAARVDLQSRRRRLAVRGARRDRRGPPPRSLGITVSIAEIYDGLSFPAAGEAVSTG